MRIRDANGAFTLDVTPGEARRRWCDTCQTSSGVDVDLYVLAEDGPRKFGVYAGCLSCARPSE